MPELPEVETMRRDLALHLPGKQIVAAWVARPAQLVEPAPELYAARLAGALFCAPRRRAKRLILPLCLADQRRAALLIEVRMTGQFVFSRPDEPRHAHDRFGWRLADGRELRLRDQRAFARVSLLDVDEEGRLRDQAGQDPLAAIGPEPLDRSFSSAVLAARLSGKRAIKAALLDQSVVAGIGNIYADEALWAAGIDPRRPAGDLDPDELDALGTAVVDILRTAVERRGSTVNNYASLGAAGSMQAALNAYGRGGQPCRRCESRLRAFRVAGRSTVACPSCQV